MCVANAIVCTDDQGSSTACTTDLPDSASVQLLQVGFSVQPGQPAKGDEKGSVSRPHKKTHENATPTHERVWLACKGPRSEPQTSDEQAAGLKPMDMMKCTAPQKATELCCQDWGSIEWSESLGFAPDSPRVDDGPPTALQLNKDAEVIHVCTFGESPRALMEEAGSNGGGMISGGCFETHFTEDTSFNMNYN